MKFLIIHSGTAGEIVFSTALIRALKVQVDNSLVFYLTSSLGKMLLEDNPYLHRIILLESNTEVKELRGIDFEFILDLDANVRSTLVSTILKGKVLRLEGRSWKTWLLTRLKINKLIPTNRADQFLEIVRKLGVKNDGLRLDYFIPYKDEVPLEWLPTSFQKNFVTFCISAPYATRALPVKRMIELCDKINKPIILLGSKDDIVIGQTIEDFFKRHAASAHLEESLFEMNKKTVVYNACGKFNLHQQASLVKQSRYVFTFDNDFVAIASAFARETYVLYGNTVVDFGRYPYNTRFTVLENNRLPCRPCSSKGFGSCPLTHFKCMNEIIFDFYLP